MLSDFLSLFGDLPYGYDFLPYLLYGFLLVSLFFNVVSIFRNLMGLSK